MENRKVVTIPVFLIASILTMSSVISMSHIDIRNGNAQSADMNMSMTDNQSMSNEVEASSRVVNPPSTISLDWGETLKIVGLAGILSAVLSAVFTHYFSVRKLKQEIQIRTIEDRKILYGQIKFDLDRMIANPDFKKGIESTKKLEDTIEHIDDILMPHYYLVAHELQKKWWEVRESFKAASKSPFTSNSFEEFKKQVSNMDEMLKEELEKL